jgi:hypothetical protein
MARPVLHKARVIGGGKQVGGNGVLEHVEVPLVFREACLVAVALHEHMEHDATDGQAESSRLSSSRAKNLIVSTLLRCMAWC